MATAVEPLTAEQYLSRDDAVRHTELIDGRIVVNEPTLAHQKVVFAVAAALEAWVGGRGHGTASLALDIALEPRVVLAPDVLWFAEPIPISSVRAPRMPDLAVEVRSRSTGRADTGRKRNLYERHGARELWLVDHEQRTVRVLSRSGAHAERFDTDRTLTAADTLLSPILPDFAVPVAALFASFGA